MNRKITLLAFMSLISLSTFAGGGWAASAVNITKDGGESYLYGFYNETWTDGNWGLNSPFEDFNFGSPISLVLNGAAANAWTNDTPGYNSTSFVLYYRVYKSNTTPGSWSQIAIDNLYMKNVNIYDHTHYIYDKTNADINILALATLNGTNTYTLEVTISKNQFFTGGNWNSMIPGDQTVGYDSANVGYRATFTKSISTGISKIESSLRISTETSKITARFDGKTQVQLFTCTGQLISSTTAENEFSKAVKSGAYLLRIDGQSHKVLVQ